MKNNEEGIGMNLVKDSNLCAMPDHPKQRDEEVMAGEVEIDPDSTHLGPRITSGSGVRGLYGNQKSLSEKDTFTIAIDGYLYATDQLAGAIKSSPKEKEFRFVVGRDPRPTGEAIEKALFHGISTAVSQINSTSAATEQISVTIIDVDISTTPVVQNAVRHFNTIGGVIITASHNPKEWNGYKFLTANYEYGNPYTQRGALLSFGRMDKFKKNRFEFLKKLSKQDDEVSAIAKTLSSTVSEYSFFYKSEGMKNESLEAYFGFLRKMVGLEDDTEFLHFVDKVKHSDIQIILDHNGGAAKGTMADLHRRFGLKIEEIGGDYGIDLHRIEPEGEALSPAKRKLEKVRKGFAVVHDWDADRGTLVLLSDGDANDLGPQYTCALNMYAMINQYLPYFREKVKPASIVVVVNGNTSGSARVIAKKISEESNVDIKIVEVETGEVNLVEKMEEVARNKTGIPVIGIEGSCGGVIFGGDKIRATSRDGTLSALMAAKLVVSTGQPLGSIVKSLPPFYTCFKSIDGIFASSLDIKQALESDFKRRVVKGENNTFTLTGIEEKKYRAYEILHYIGTEVYDEMKENTNGGYKIRLTDIDGNESFLWYRDSKTEPEIYIESDSADSRESKLLFELLYNVVMRVNGDHITKSEKNTELNGKDNLRIMDTSPNDLNIGESANLSNATPI